MKRKQGFEYACEQRIRIHNYLILEGIILKVEKMYEGCHNLRRVKANEVKTTTSKVIIINNLLKYNRHTERK